jgi:hypothetical protein
LIFPAQPDIPTSVDYRKHNFVKPDPSIYESDEPYPSEIATVVGNGYFDGDNHVVTLAVYPLQYRPKSGLFTLFSSIDFELKMKAGKTREIHGGVRSEENQKIYYDILKKLVDNPQDIPLYQVRPMLGKAMSIQTNPLPSYEYVIISTNALKDNLKPFISWKKRKGLNIGVITMEQILTYYSTDLISGITDNAGALRQYLSDSYYYGSPKTMYALFAGDYTVVPIRCGAGSENNW